MTLQLSQSDAQLLQALKMLIQKNDPVPATDQGSPYAHGTGGPGALGGVLSYPGVYPDMFSAVPRPMTPAALLWSTMTNRYDYPLYDTFTGVTDSTDDCPDDDCGRYPTAGTLKSCIITAPFGTVAFQTPTRELNNIGRRVNIGETDRQLINFNFQQNPFFPNMGGGVDINSQAFHDFLTVGLHYELTLSRLLFQGDFSNGRCAGNYNGALMEFNGFDVLITTGITDAVSGQACPKLDSIVYDYGSAEVGASGSPDIVTQIAHRFRALQTRAMRQGFVGVNWVIFMHPDLFFRLTELWPCAYLTNRCTLTNTEAEVTIGGAEQTMMRDQMRANSFLWINGQRVQVVEADGVPHAAYGPGFRTDMYFVPISANGRRVTYLEAYDMSGGGEMFEYNNALGAINDVGTLNNNAYLVTKERAGVCLNYKFKMEPRLVLRTPQLAMKIENIVYSLYEYSQSPYHTDEYYRDGGLTYRPVPSFYDSTGDAIDQTYR